MATNYDHIIQAIKQVGKPLQRSDFRDILGMSMDDRVLGVLLHKMVERNQLGMVKFQGTPSFYVHPEWLDEEGNLIEDWDPIFKQWKKDVHNHGIKD